MESPLLNFLVGSEYQKKSVEDRVVFHIVFVFHRSIVPAVQILTIFWELDQRSETLTLDTIQVERR